MSAQDWRNYLHKLKCLRPGDLVREKKAVSPQYGVTDHILKYQNLNSRPVFIFDKVEGKPFPVLTNLMATRERLALALDTSVAELARVFTARSRQLVSPRLLPGAPFQANRWTGGALDLSKLPLLTHFRGDAGAYITAGLVVARDPRSGAETLGYHRLQYQGPDRLGLSLHSRQRLWEYQRRAEERGVNLEAAVVLGVHPAISLGSLVDLPLARSKYLAAGGLLGEALEVARCASVDLAVPAWAEIVIEGEILCGARAPEGPFTEICGICEDTTGHVFVARSMSFRDGAIYQSITPARGFEHVTLMALARESEIWQALGDLAEGVENICASISEAGLFRYYLSVKKYFRHQSSEIIRAALSLNNSIVDRIHKPPSCLAVVVDEDVDVFDEAAVREAVAARGIEIVPVDCPGTRGIVLMPKLGATMREALVTRWLKQEGEEVEKGEFLVEVLTKKAVFKVESPVSGRIYKILASPGTPVAVNKPLAVLAEEGDAAGVLQKMAEEAAASL